MDVGGVFSVGFADGIILTARGRAFERLVSDAFDVFSGYNEGWRGSRGACGSSF